MRGAHDPTRISVHLDGARYAMRDPSVSGKWVLVHEAYGGMDLCVKDTR